MMKLKDWIPADADAEGSLWRHFDKEIVSVHDGCEECFPFTGYRPNYRNVNHWVILEDGSAVGWNESPRNGWSFPRVGKKTVTKQGY